MNAPKNSSWNPLEHPKVNPVRIQQSARCEHQAYVCTAQYSGIDTVWVIEPSIDIMSATVAATSCLSILLSIQRTSNPSRTVVARYL